MSATATAASAPEFTPEQLVAQASPATFGHVVSGGLWVPYDHLILLNDYLLRVAAGEIKRLIVTMPPRMGKSELISRYLPAWYLGTFPDRQVILVSFGKELAEGHGEAARELLTEFGPPVFGVSVKGTAKASWGIKGRKGVMLSRSLRGQLTGSGAHLLLIDDPIKDEADAQSELKRERLWTWWEATASTRLQIMGDVRSAVIVVQTRWHENDLAGRLKATGRWETLNLPLFAEADDPLGRAEGETLCPEVLTQEQSQEIKDEKSSYYFSALYQQRPMPAEGIAFKRKDFRYYRVRTVEGTPFYMLQDESKVRTLAQLQDDDEDVEDGWRTIDGGYTQEFQVVDAAASEKQEADYSVVGTFAVTEAHDLLVLDIARQHFEAMDVPGFVKRESDKHGRPPMWIESLGHGLGPFQELSRQGYPIRKLNIEQGSKDKKMLRALLAIAACERHKVFFPVTTGEYAVHAPWLGDFEDELVAFWRGRHDDQVDVLAYAARVLPMVTFRKGPVMSEPKGKPLGAGIMDMQF